MTEFKETLERIEAMLAVLVERQTVKEFYEIEEFSKSYRTKLPPLGRK
jgi:hypothetical protein